MNQKFLSSLQQRDDVTYLKLSGVIDEDNELFELLDRLSTGALIVDLAEIERINSCGVRDWVNWLSKLEKKGARLVLAECSPAIVAQINLVNNFTGSSVVSSFYAPYFCPSCDLEKALLVDMEEMRQAGDLKAPTCRCDECDGVMDFDDMEESYFAFVATASKAQVDPEISKIVSDFGPKEAAGGARKVRSRAGSAFLSSGSSKGGSGPGSGSGSGPGSKPGSQVSSVSLPSLPSVPSLPSLPSIAGLERSKPEALAKLQQQAAESQGRARVSSRSNLPMILVIVLLLTAIGLLLYVILTGDSKGTEKSMPKEGDPQVSAVRCETYSCNPFL